MTFAGIPVEALDFYEDLENDNTKSFWTAHKHVYEKSVRDPMRALADELSPEFGTVRFFRPYRDVRFAADKSPYKTQQGMVLGGHYVHVGAPDWLHTPAAATHVAAAWRELAPLKQWLDDHVGPSDQPRR